MTIPDEDVVTTASVSTSTPILASSLTTCKSIQSDDAFADDQDEIRATGVDGSLENIGALVDLDEQIRRLDEELAKHREIDKLKDKVFCRNASLPSSPMVRVKRLIFPKTKQLSAHNLMSFGNINWDGAAGREKVFENENQNPAGVVGGTTARGTSLPSTPNKAKSALLLRGSVNSIMNKGGSVRNKKKLSLDEDKFLLWNNK